MFWKRKPKPDRASEIGESSESGPKPLNEAAFSAVLAGDEGELRALIQRGADVNHVHDLGRSLLHIAVCYAPTLVEPLLKAGARPNAADADGFTALHFAAQQRELESAKALLKAGATVDVQNRYGNTPLFTATFYCGNGEGNLIKLLLAAGADRNLKNASGVSPYQLACTIANYDVKRWYEGVGDGGEQ